jgi:serine/threonine-protein kinase
MTRPKYKDEASDGAAYVLTGPATDPIAALAGTTLAHYEVEALIGRGHSGAVYRARDTRHNAAVALKVLADDFPKTDPEKQRYLAAMKVMLPLRHPHIVILLGTGKATHYCWLALEYIQGESASALLAQHPKGLPDWKDALRTATQVARALEFAHRHQIYHGNVTPGNVLIRQADKVAKLGDLILHRAIEGSHLRKASFQKKVAAELGYLPPEQTQSPDRADAGTDLYGLGATTYALLTGRPPFQSGSTHETVRNIRKVDPDSPREIKPTVPEVVSNIVLRLLEKAPEDRYSSAADLVAVLEQLARKAHVAC